MFKTSIFTLDLCDYSDANIFVKGRINVEGNNVTNTRNIKLIFKNNAPFRSCTAKINNTFIDNTEDVDNYSMASSRSLLNYYREEVNDDANENNAAHNKINNNKTRTSTSFEYKTKLTGSSPNNNNMLDADVVVSLKYLSISWRFLDLPLIKCDMVKVFCNFWNVYSTCNRC